jgi:hypothetical protein
MEKLYGREHTEILWLIGRQGLLELMDLEDPVDTHLKVDYSDRNPDNVPSVVYDKGALFLRLLEEHFGRAEWDAFLNDYFERHAFGTVTNEMFLADLRSEFGEGDAWLEAEIQAWVHGPGLPDSAPQIESPALDEVEQRLQAWLDGGDLPAEEDWSSHEWMHFVRALPLDLSLERMRELDDAYQLSGTGNAEVLTAWLTLTLGSGDDRAFGSMEAFVTSMGRAKFLRPLYRKLCETPDGCAQARKLYERAKPGYHPVAVTSVDQVFEAADGGGS